MILFTIDAAHQHFLLSLICIQTLLFFKSLPYFSICASLFWLIKEVHFGFLVGYSKYLYSKDEMVALSRVQMPGSNVHYM